MTKRKPKREAGTLDRIAAKLDELSPARRRAIEMELAKVERRASAKGARRGRPPKHGETLSDGVLVRCTTALKAEMSAAAKRLGVDGIAEYLRELHALFLHAEGTFRKMREAERER